MTFLLFSLTFRVPSMSNRAQVSIHKKVFLLIVLFSRIVLLLPGSAQAPAKLNPVVAVAVGLVLDQPSFFSTLLKKLILSPSVSIFKFLLSQDKGRGFLGPRATSRLLETPQQLNILKFPIYLFTNKI